RSLLILLLTAAPATPALSLHDALPIFPLALRGHDPFLDGLGRLRVLVQVVVEICLEEIPDERAEGFTVRGDGGGAELRLRLGLEDRKSTRLNSSHVKISYAVFCLKKKI